MVKLVRNFFAHRGGVGGGDRALGLRLRGGIEVPQFYTPRWDPTVFVAPNADASLRAARMQRSRPCAAGDLVDASGNCAGAPRHKVNGPRQPLFARNVALQMTECEVVRSLGSAGIDPDRRQ